MVVNFSTEQKLPPAAQPAKIDPDKVEKNRDGQ